MVYLSLADTLSLLYESVGAIPAKDLVKKCRDLGMDELPYMDTGYDSNLPHFDKGYMFNYKSDGNQRVFLEILEKDERILQAGIQITYKFFFASKNMERHHKYLSEISEKHYGSGLPTTTGYADIINYGDKRTACYLSKMRVRGIKSLVFRIGDRQFWR
jgi:hypothetical protein